jgi:hypothetical protein
VDPHSSTGMHRVKKRGSLHKKDEMLPLLSACTWVDWVTISQSRFGAQVDTIRDLYHGGPTEPYTWPHPRSKPDHQLLGYLWCACKPPPR